MVLRIFAAGDCELPLPSPISYAWLAFSPWVGCCPISSVINSAGFCTIALITPTGTPGYRRAHSPSQVGVYPFCLCVSWISCSPHGADPPQNQCNPWIVHFCSHEVKLRTVTKCDKQNMLKTFLSGFVRIWFTAEQHTRMTKSILLYCSSIKLNYIQT